MDYSKHPKNTFALRIKDLNGQIKEHEVDRDTYIQYVNDYGKLYGKTTVFKTLAGNRVRGILDNAICQLNLGKS